MEESAVRSLPTHNFILLKNGYKSRHVCHIKKSPWGVTKGDFIKHIPAQWLSDYATYILHKYFYVAMYVWHIRAYWF